MGRNIRVAMVGAYPTDTSSIWGGVQAAYTYLVKGLIRTGNVEIHILTIRPANSTAQDYIEQGDLKIHLLPPYPRFERLRNYSTYQTTINKKLAQIQPDLVHAQDAGADALVALRSGFPVVTTVHGIRREDGKHYSSFNKRLRNYFDSLVTEQYVMRNARYMIAISRYVTSYFKNILRRDIDVYYVPNAIDERFFNVTKYPDRQVVLFAGRVIPRKRVTDLVRSFELVLQKVPTAQLHIAGEIITEPDYVESIRRLARQSHIEEHVHFLGPLSEEAIIREVAGCSLLALPSIQETTPMVIAQAMAAGKPVVATRVGGVGEMVGEDGSRGFLTDVGDIDRFAAAMIRLLQNADLQAELGQCGRAFAMQNYHIESVAQRTYDVYQRIALKEQKSLV